LGSSIGVADVDPVRPKVPNPKLAAKTNFMFVFMTIPPSMAAKISAATEF
jgi:hypothetical protein